MNQSKAHLQHEHRGRSPQHRGDDTVSRNRSIVIDEVGEAEAALCPTRMLHERDEVGVRGGQLDPDVVRTDAPADV
jgi:hypothetical protein